MVKQVFQIESTQQILLKQGKVGRLGEGTIGRIPIIAGGKGTRAEEHPKSCGREPVVATTTGAARRAGRGSDVRASSHLCMPRG